MKIYRELSEENKNLSIALGFFDGVHLAHKKLIEKTVELAKNSGQKSAVLTFSEAPASVILKREPVYLEPIGKKISRIGALGLDFLYILNFDDFKNMKAHDYLNEIILKHLAPKYIVTGFNHTFGLNREGDCNYLKKFAQEYEYVQIPPVKIDNTLISSTNIKKNIETGEIEFANKMLGRNFSYSGCVVKGAQIARTLGYKTANIIWQKHIVRPKYGVYKGFTVLGGKKYLSLINFGIRPTVDKDLKEMLEVHIVGFNGNLYGETIEVEFFQKIRDEVKFSSIDELKTQINKDYKAVL